MENDNPKDGQKANDKTVVATLAMALGMPFLLALFIIISSWSQIVEPKDDKVARPPLDPVASSTETAPEEETENVASTESVSPKESVKATVIASAADSAEPTSEDKSKVTVADADPKAPKTTNEKKPEADMTVAATENATAESSEPKVAPGKQPVALEPNLLAGQPAEKTDPKEDAAAKPEAPVKVAAVPVTNDLKEEVSNLKKQLKAAEAKLAAEQAVKAKALAEVSQLKEVSEETDNWKELAEKAQAQLADAQKLANTRDDRIKELQAKLQSQESQILASARSSLRRATEPLEVKLRSLESEHSFSQAALEGQGKAVQEAQKKAAAAQSKFAAAEKTIAQLKTQMAELPKEVVLNEADQVKMRSVAAENAALKASLESVREQLNAAQEATLVAKKQASSASAKATLVASTSISQAAEMQKALQAARSAPKESGKNEALEAKVRSLSAENAGLLAKLTGLESQMGSHEAAGNQLRHQVATLNRQLAQNASTDSAQVASTESTPAVSALQELQAKAQERLAAAQKLANSRGETIQSLQDQLKKLRETSVKAPVKTDAAPKVVAQTVAPDKKQLEKEVDTLTSKLSTEQALKAELLQKVSHLQEKMKTAAASSEWLGKLRQEIAALKQQNGETQARLSEVQAQAKARHEKFSELESVVNSALKGSL